jgi:hypothetical protein
MTAAVVLASIEGMPWTYWLGVGVSLITGVFIAILLVEYHRRVVSLEDDVERWNLRRRRT